MGSLNSFIFVSLNGFYKGKDEDISWHRHGEEESQFAAQSMQKGEGILVFGRKTYEMMAAWWPTAEARQQMPEVAAGMNEAKKIVISNSLQKVNWENTTVLNTDIIASLTELKDRYDMTILGSGALVASLAGFGLIDTFDVMVDPVALPEGTAFLDGISKKIDLELKSTRTFKSGVTLLSYKPQ